MPKLIFLLLFVFLFRHAEQAAVMPETNIIWEDHFTKKEKKKLTTWLQRISLAVSETLGGFPFEINLYVHRSDNNNEPVPWAHTVRDGEEGVHFYVSAGYGLEAFLTDWTAPHEIAHLSIPYLGKENMWFSEGYASYMQYQVMLRAGVMTADEMAGKYQARLQRIRPLYDSEKDFLALSKELKSQYNYSGVYWGGACFFMQADSLLRSERNMSLTDVISQYQSNGRGTDQNLNDLIESLDEICGSTVFSDLLYRFRNGSARQAVLSTSVPDVKTISGSD